MGLLDDAIREHLELKRRSGTDARQLAQLEHEAFGPIRRGDPALDIGPPGPSGAVDEPEDAVPDEEYVYEEAAATDAPAADDLGWDEPAPPEPGDEPRWEDEQVAPADEPLPLPVPETDPVFPLGPATPPEEVEEAWEDELEPAPEPEASQPLDQPTAAYSLDELEALDAPASEPSPAPPPPAPPAPPPADEPPTEIASRDVVPADEEPGEHDVLEDTPDFLEETPEHDRLWFEQKPPKDFDF